ncbi:MAG: cob(I)yrinic acid a,c-diamide adenosyltransferase [Colwelliaceae bacterium]|nr:cob(I)yrinic acid a,c-diamide adenosyltransferase [Colwelliaceae bacterium]|tara:strand:+ start:399 stop:1013 length:615 start_codon:yes stop_codon:yes gene_type:complete
MADNNHDQRKNDNHKARQQRLKEKVDEKVANAKSEGGVFQVITGNGKGKSTAGFGTVTRAVGHGLKCAVVQFIKGTWGCGERDVLEKLGVTFDVMATGFTWETQNRESDIAAAEKAWQSAKQYLSDDSIDMVLLDELTYMLSYDYLDTDEVIEAIKNRPSHQFLVVTGRAAHRKLTDLADTVSEVRNVKHAFEAGIMAQKGFDY